LLKRAGSEATDASRSEATAGELRAVLLSLPAALAIPVAGAFLLPVELADYEALLWLLALIPAFLLAYHRGWRGAATTLAFGMVVLSITYAATQALGRPVPHLLWGVLTFYVGITLGIGWLAERVSRKKYDEASSTLALRDPLTELPNRRYAEVYLDQEFAAAERGRSLAVVLFDFDNFHEFNSLNGRSAGDGVLRGFANLLRQTTRRMNVSARYGPEEFLCILGSCDENGALTFAARIRERLRAAESTVSLPTASVGIAVYGPGLDTPRQLLSAAEDALLLAKRAGRDRVRVWGSEVDAEAELAIQNAERVLAHAQAPHNAVRIEIAADLTRPIGTARSACVIMSDAVARAKLAGWLGEERFLVVEAAGASDAMQALHAEHDVVFADLDAAPAGLADLIGEVRTRSASTRIIGVLRTSNDGAIPPELLQVRVDAHYIPRPDPASFKGSMADLLRERDRIRAAEVRAVQLTDEVRAKDREGKAALAASEARYRAVIQAIQQVIFTTDVEGRWTFLNAAWTSITGFGVDDATGDHIWDYVHPDERDDLRENFKRLVSRSNAYFRHEGRWRSRSGTYRWMESRFQVSIDARSNIEGATGVLTDVTERRRVEDALRRSEEYYRSLIENSEDMMAVMNADETVRYASPAVVRALGYATERWAEMDAQALLHPDDRDRAHSAFVNLLEEPGASATYEARVRHANGAWRTLEVTMRNHLTTVGVEGVVVNARDVTDRRRTENALRESEELLAQSRKMEAIGRLAGGVAHDFNNLLTAIQGHAALLLEQTSPDAEIHADVKEIRDAALRATALTRQLLAFSRRQVLQLRNVDLNDIVTDMEKILRRVIGEHISFELDLASDLGTVRADAAQLEQVILNLVVNAKDALPRGGRISVRTANRTIRDTVNAAANLAPGEYVMLEIADSGTGMEPEIVDQAFEPFFTTKEPGKGTGLGLATVYGIVKQCGGHVWLESTVGAGTAVTIYLPRIHASVDADGAASQDVELPDAIRDAELRGTERILLVEDEPSVRELAKRILERSGYSVTTAANGLEAVNHVTDLGPIFDLVLSDIVMPVMDGGDMADRLAEMHPEVKVLLMSGYAEELVMRQGDIGDRAFIAKPFSPNELLLKLREVINAGR
jgi:diguanylate cyclase (GGDEF)-like protein/PAS domain S-box-containing protein